MRQYIKISILIFLSICFLFGCISFSKPVKPISYYTLEYDSPTIKGRRILPFAVFVERFQVTPLYDSNKIIYRNNEYKREAYSYHKWRTNPGDMVSQLLARDFKETSLFKAVFTLDSRFPSSHILKGTVLEFYEKDGEDRWEGILTLSVALIRKDEADPLKSVVFQKNYTIKEVCAKKNPQALAEAMSNALKKISVLIIRDIYKRLS